jgi:hypothetical protein
LRPDRSIFENKREFPIFEIFLTKGPRFFPVALDKVPDPVYTPGHATGNGGGRDRKRCQAGD